MVCYLNEKKHHPNMGKSLCPAPMALQTDSEESLSMKKSWPSDLSKDTLILSITHVIYYTPNPTIMNTGLEKLPIYRQNHANMAE